MSFQGSYYDPSTLAWMLALGAHTYYHTPQESHLTDAQYEALVTLTIQHWGKLTAPLRSLLVSPQELRSTGYYIKLTPRQEEGAREILRLRQIYGSQQIPSLARAVRLAATME